MASSSTSCNCKIETTGVQKAAAFLGGFILPFPLYIVVNFSSFAVERFHLPPDKIPLFINKFFSSMEISCLVGMMITCAIVVVLGDNSNLLSIVNIWFFFITVVILFENYNYGGDFGDVSLYYWMVNILGFVLGYNYISMAKVAANDNLLAILGRTLSGIVVVIYQMGFYYIGSYYGLEDLGRWMFIWFFIILIVVSLSAAISWTIGYRKKEDEKKCCCKCCTSCAQAEGTSCNCKCCKQQPPCDTSCQCGSEGQCCCCCKSATCQCTGKNCCKCCCCNSGSKGEGSFSDLITNPRAISPLFMFPISNPIAYSFNPSIAPYQFLGLIDGYKVSLLVTFTTCIPSCVFTILKYGLQDDGKNSPESKWEGNLAFYHMAWCAMLPLLSAAAICLIMLHYPYCRISRYFYRTKFRIYLLCIALQLSNEVMLGIGMGVGSQGNSKNGTLTALSLLLAFITLVIGMFISDGYLKTYRKADRDHWPTKGYTRYRGFKFWFGSGVKEARKTFREVFTKDMRKLLMSYE